MAGGGTMRSAAAILAGFTAATSGRHVFAGNHTSVPSSARAALPLEDVELVTSPTRGGVQRAAASETDDSVFAGGEGVEGADTVVSGGAPTLQEAEEATSEPDGLLQLAYLSPPNSVGGEGSSVADNGSWSSHSSSHSEQNNAGPANDIVIRSGAPSDQLIIDLKLLFENRAAVQALTSLASDPNLWAAAEKNSVFQEMMQTDEYEGGPAEDSHVMNCLQRVLVILMLMQTDAYEGGAAEDSAVDELSPKSVGDSCGDKSSEPDGGFMDFVQKIKSTVVDMMSSLPGFFQSSFAGQGLNKVFVNPDGSAKVSAKTVMEASFLGLAIMAIMVILRKRV